MSKRKNMQGRRRQVRRALNAAPEVFKGMGMGRINRIGYGCGLGKGDVGAAGTVRRDEEQA